MLVARPWMMWVMMLDGKHSVDGCTREGEMAQATARDTTRTPPQRRSPWRLLRANLYDLGLLLLPAMTETVQAGDAVTVVAPLEALARLRAG